MEKYLLQLIQSGLGASPWIAAVVIILYLYLKKIVTGMDERVKNLEINHTRCREGNFAMHDEDKKELGRLDREILKGINEIKVYIAKLEGRNSLAEDIAKILKNNEGK